MCVLCGGLAPHAGLLSANNRLVELGKIVSKFEEIAAEQRGEVKAMVTTAEVRQRFLRCVLLCSLAARLLCLVRHCKKQQVVAGTCLARPTVLRLASTPAANAAAHVARPADAPAAALAAAAAQGLSPEEVEEIKRGLQPLLKPGQKLTLEEVVSARGLWRVGVKCGAMCAGSRCVAP